MKSTITAMKTSLESKAKEKNTSELENRTTEIEAQEQKKIDEK